MTESAGGLEAFYEQVTNVSDFIWGGAWNGEQAIPFAPMVIILLGVGVYMMIALKFYPITSLPEAFASLFKKEGAEHRKGEISPFAALSTALSGQIGTGNMAGVATAITLGGPGALFWMWVTALLGSALAFAEGALAIRYREQREDGHYQGGPMYYMRHGLGPKWRWLAVVFCVGGFVAAIAVGNMIQANSLADSVSGLTGMPEWVAGLIGAVLVFAVIIGGIKSIGAAAEKIVPTMAAMYLIMAFVALALNIQALPEAIGTVFASAFTGHAAAGGFLGAGVLVAIRAGVARGLFSNEAGQGSTPMAHAVAQTDNPARQGRFAVLGTLIDTLVVCTATGLVILTTQGSFVHTDAAGVVTTQPHAWMSDLRGFDMTSGAFGAAFPFEVLPGISLGALVASVAVLLFVFTTMVTWSYYAERSITYLFGQKAALPCRLLWVAMIVVGSVQQVEFVWRFGDIAVAAMAIPNLLALAMLSSVVVALAKGDRTAGKDYE